MIVIGVVLLIVGLLISIPVLWYIGIALIVIGLLLNLTGWLRAPLRGRPVLVLAAPLAWA